ncbi:MAG: S-layer homology domain-containing protein [Thermoclostridium sp.]|nr:S-layer homology domain-containing protein [Thermoclostridium sp.]
MKKVIITLVIVCILMSQLGVAAFAAFNKASEWAVPELTKAEAYGLIPNSIKNDMSKPITRKEFAEVCVLVYELTTKMTAQSAPASTFTDTKDINVLKAFNIGIVTGIGEGKFGPDLTTNREQIATMLNRLLNALTPDMHTFSSESDSYTDENQISSWAKESVDRASQLKFITGWNSQFNAKGTCTREMAVVIAKRVYEFYNEQEELSKGTLNKIAILEIAEKYYQKTIDLVEEKDEFSRVIDFTPDFTGAGKDPEKASGMSMDTASLITFTDAKNMSTAFAAAVFTLDPDSAVTANNLATAIASYNDRLLETEEATEEIYQDSASVWLYALQQSEKEGELTSGSLTILVSLGNLYMDTNRFNQAYAAFSEAYQFDKNCSGARLGLMNYYLAKGDLENALKYLDGQGYPIFAQKLSDIAKEQPDIQDEEPVSTETGEAEMEEIMQENTEIPVISGFDFYEFIDPQAYIDAKNFIDNVKSEMRYNAPEITIISQYSALERISEPMGQSALESFGVGLKELYKKFGEAQAQESLDSVGRLGIDVDLGGASIQDIIQNPEKYEDLETTVTGVEEAEEKLMEMVQKAMDAANNLKANDFQGAENVDKVLGSVSQVIPENEIYNYDPYEYSNYLDFFVQRLNVSALQRKMQVLPFYSMKMNSRIQIEMNEQIEAVAEKIAKIDEAEEEAIELLEEELKNNDHLTPLEKARKFHEIHETYRPQRNAAKKLAYNQLTSLTDEAYLKHIKPNAEKVYNDCMGHIMLISDSEVQKSLENRLISQVLNAVTGALNNVYVAYSAFKYEEPFECCNLPELEAEELARREAEAEAEKFQALNDEEARKRFEAGEIDENSLYYKKCIEPYEAKINFIIVKARVGPYKTGWEANIGSEALSEAATQLTGVKAKFGSSVNFGKMTNHLTNATTYNGGITFTAKVGNDKADAKLSTTIGATFTKDANGNFSPNDIDVYSKTEATGRIGFNAFTAGCEVSAARGTRFHGKAVIKSIYINKAKQGITGFWPELEKKIWDGKYKVKEKTEPKP